MAKAVGSRSYIAFGMQTAFGTVQTSLTTAAHLRTGTVFSPRQANQPRLTTGTIMPRASQYWQAMDLTDVDLGFEYVYHDTAFLPIFTAAWGKRVKTGASAPFAHQYLLNDPPVDTAVADGGGTFYGRGLTIRQVLHDGTSSLLATVVKDVCINTFTMDMPANDSMKFSFTGTGQDFAVSSAPSFTDVSGTTAAWADARETGNSGLYVGTTFPTSTAALARRVQFTLNNNLRYEPFLGAAPGLELSTPHRAGFPSAQFEFEMDFENVLVAGRDAVDIMTDYTNNVRNNVRVEYFLDANNSIEIYLGGTVDGGIIDSPQPVFSNEGVVGFTFTLIAAPDDMTAGSGDDLTMIQSTGT